MGAAIAKEQVTYVGDLTYVDMSEKTFEIRIDDRKVKGTFDKAISTSHPAQLPKRYAATLTVSTKISVPEGQDDTSYFLLRLEDVPSDSSSTSLLPL
jgi:hypothetical protein